MKRVLVTVFAMAFAATGFAVESDDICGVGVPVNVISVQNWTITLAYKVSLKGQSLWRTADVIPGDESCVYDLGTMAKINDKTYLIMNIDLPINDADWFCTGPAIGPNVAGIDLNNVWVWFGDELVDFYNETEALDAWKLKGFVDDKTAGKGAKKAKALYALTWFTSYSDSDSGNDGEFDVEYAYQFPPAAHLADPTRDMQTGTMSMQLLSDGNKSIALNKLVDKNCGDSLVPVPMSFDGCLHGFVDWYNPHVNCWEHLNLNVSARLDKKLTKCLNSCTVPVDPGCDFDNPTTGYDF